MSSTTPTSASSPSPSSPELTPVLSPGQSNSFNIVFEPKMAQEVFAAALASSVLPDNLVTLFPVNRSGQVLPSAIFENGRNVTVFLGSYWLEQLASRTAQAVTTDGVDGSSSVSNKEFIVYKVQQDSSVPLPAGVTSIVSGQNGTVAPLEAIVIIIKSRLPVLAGAIDVIVSQFEKSGGAEIVLNRAFARVPEQTNAFFAGFYNYAGNVHNNDLFAAAKDVIDGTVTVQKLQSDGTLISLNQLQLATERANNNAGLFVTHDGQTVVATTAPELVNLTHGALLKKYGPAVVGSIAGTMTVNLKFNHGTGPEHGDRETVAVSSTEPLANCKLSFSLRSNNDSTNPIMCKDIATAMTTNCDGDKNLAGGQTTVVIPAFASVFANTLRYSSAATVHDQ